MTTIATQPGFAQATVSAVQGFANAAIAAASDPGLIMSAATGLVPPSGYTYGRYANGALGVPLSANTTVAQALSAAITARTTVEVAAAAAVSAAAASTLPAFVPAIQVLTEAVRSISADPSSAVRLLSGLAGYLAPAGTGFPGLYATLVCRRCSLISLALATADYAPSSYQDGASVLSSVTMLLDAEIQTAADLFDVTTYQAFRAMRTAVVNDLTTRSAAVPSLMTITTPAPMPALALAYQLYGDASRCDELVTKADPVSPLFLPTQLTVLSA
jgi:prophage DNA circulation protein